MTDYIVRTDNAELKLTTTASLTQEEWDTLTASLTALYPLAVPEGTRTATKLLSELDGLEKTPQTKLPDWSDPIRDTHYDGPLSDGTMGMRLAHGERAVVSQPTFPSVHPDRLHLWVVDPTTPNEYTCGHVRCNATCVVTVTQ